MSSYPKDCQASACSCGLGCRQGQTWPGAKRYLAVKVLLAGRKARGSVFAPVRASRCLAHHRHLARFVRQRKPLANGRSWPPTAGGGSGPRSSSEDKIRDSCLATAGKMVANPAFPSSVFRHRTRVAKCWSPASPTCSRSKIWDTRALPVGESSLSSHLFGLLIPRRSASPP